MPEVSVVVPVHNTAQYLDECIQSLLDQSLQDIEIVCVDDGSTDNSLEVLRKYACQDARVVVLSQQNKGPGAARNAGIAVARGAYLSFVDSDDLLSTHSLEHLLDVANRADLDLLYFDATPFCDDEDLAAHQERFSAYYQRNNDYPGVMAGRELMARMLENGDYKPAICFQFMRAEFLRSEGITFKEGILHEDNLFSFFCALAARRAAYTPETFYQRRVRADSIMTGEKSTAHFIGYFVTYLEMLRAFLQNDFDDPTAEAAGRIAARIHQQAGKALAALPAEQRETITVIDGSPEAIASLEILKRQALQTVRTDRLKAKLKKTQDKLQRSQREIERIKGSRAYRIMAAARRIVRFGR